MKIQSKSDLNPGSYLRSGWIFPALLALLAVAAPLPAAPLTWLLTPTDGNWETAGATPTSEVNWNSGTTNWPGGISTTTTDIATFNTNSSVTTVIINGSDWNIDHIVFSNANCAAYTITNTESGEEARFTGGGSICISNEVTKPQLFTGSEWRIHTGGGLTLINNSGTATATLAFLGGGVKSNNGNDANPTDQAVNLQGTNPGTNTFGGPIADYTTPLSSGGAADALYYAAVTKSGTGNWYLTANNTFTGPTVVTGGLLAFKGAGAVNDSTNVIISGAGATLQFTNAMNLTTANNYLYVTNSGTLQITNTVYQTPVTVANLVVSNATLRLGVNGATPFTDISVTSGLLAGPGVTLDIDQVGQLTAATTFTLISYAGADPAAADFTVNLAPGYSGYIISPLTVGGGQITVTITPPSSASLVWVGATNKVLVSSWDTATKNWVDAATLSFPQAYANPDAVQFNDNASNSIVTLATNLAPLGIGMVNYSLNYTFNGSGLISGQAGLIKQGSASLTLAETGGDTFSGGITNDAGTLLLDDANCAIGGPLTVETGATVQIGNNDGNGNLTTGAVDDEGTLVFARTNGLLVSAAIAGYGTLTQNGSGVLTLNNANSYYGGTIVGAGALALSGAGTISNSSSLLISNATFDVSGLDGQTTLLNTVMVTNATFNVALSGAQPLPAIFIASYLYADGITTVSNKINVLSLPTLAAYPATLTVIQSAYVSLANGNFNFILGSLPAGYAGSLGESADQTSVLLTLTSGPVGARSSVIWAGTDYTSLTTNWSDNANWDLPGAPGNLDNVYFDNTGVVGAGTVDNFVDRNFTVASLTFTNLGSSNYHVTDVPAGVTLTANNFTVGGLTADGTATEVAFTDAGTLVANGATFTVGNNGATTADTGTLLDLSGLSNFVYAAGGTINQGTGNRSAANFNLAGVSNNITAGTWNANALSSSSSCSGTLTLGAGTNILNVGAFNIALERNSCTVKFPSGSTGGLRLRGAAGTDASRATMTLGDRQAGGSGGTSTGTLSFDGNQVDMKLATLTVGAAGDVTANTGDGVIDFDTGVMDATTIDLGVASIAGATANGTITMGANAVLIVGSGGLSLVNETAGTATGTLTINGGTVISSNSIVKTTAAGTATINLTDGTLNLMSGAIGTPAAPVDNLSFSDDGSLDTKLVLNVVAGLTNIVATTVSASGTTTINIASITTSGGGTVTIPLISYTGSDPFLNLALGTMPAGFTAGTLVDDQADDTIDLTFTPPPTLVWAGAVGSTLDSNWDLSTTDWRNSGVSAAYVNPDYVQFDDTASNGTVNLTTTVAPGSINFINNALGYTLKGGGSLSGAAGLTKQGSGALMLDNSGANNFSGGFTISGGSVQIGDNDANGSLPAGGVTDNGSLVFDQNVNATVANVFSGSGTVTQIGANILTLSGNNTNLTGGLSVTNGILNVTASTALGTTSGATVVTNGGTFDDNALAFNAVATPRLVVSGAGYNNAGAIINSGAAQEDAFSNVTVAANVTIGGVGRWDIRAGTGTAASLNTSPAGSAYSITKVGTNEIAFVNVGTVDAGLGNIYVQQGEFAVQTGTVSLGNPASNIMVSAGAELEVYELANPLNKVITFNGDGTNNSFSADAGTAVQNSVIGPVTLNGNCLISVQSGVFATLGGIISGPGGLNKDNAGMLTLTNAETYAGGTTVSSGTLALAGLGALASPAITVDSGTVLSVGGRSDGTLTLNAGQTLGGGGTVSGSVTALSGGTVSPSGVLTVTTNVSLAGNSLLELNGITNDVLAAGAALTYGGTLTLTNISATPLTAGSTFKLFNAASYSGTFSSIVTQPALAGGLGWTNNGNGTFSVTGVSTPVSHLAVTSFNLSGANAVISGTNAGAGTFYVLMGTNLTQPIGQWLPVATNVLSGSGSFSFTATNAVNPTGAQQYYILSTTNN